MGSSCFLTLNTVSVLDALFIVHRSITLSLLLFYPVNYTMEQDLTLRAVPHHILEVDVLWKGSGTHWWYIFTVQGNLACTCFVFPVERNVFTMQCDASKF